MPQFMWGRTAHLLSLTGGHVLPASGPHTCPFLLSPASDHLIPLVQGGNGGSTARCIPSLGFQEPSPHRCRLLWRASIGSSPCVSVYSKFRSTATILKAQQAGRGYKQRDHSWAVSQCGCPCFGRKGNELLAFEHLINQMFSPFLHIRFCF